MIDRVTVFCGTAQELQEWLENLQPFTKGGSPAGTISKVKTCRTHTQAFHVIPSSKSETCSMTKCEVPSAAAANLMCCCNHWNRHLQTVEGKPLSMVGTPTHLSHLGSLSAVSRGPLEPPKISKPWSLSCLRPAPPLKPSAALGYKEVRGCTGCLAPPTTPPPVVSPPPPPPVLSDEKPPTSFFLFLFIKRFNQGHFLPSSQPLEFCLTENVVSNKKWHKQTEYPSWNLE